MAATDRLFALHPDTGPLPLAELEKTLKQRGVKYVAGVDEAGRGAWAGPVVAAAVILPVGFSWEGLKDSKKLTPRRREILYDLITRDAVAWGLGVTSARYVDRHNILQATLEAMRRAVLRLPIAPGFVLVDGNQPIPTLADQLAVVGGDGRCACIAAASIIAKVYRDRVMNFIHRRCPGYGFDMHKGYGTATHAAALRRLGASRYHRLTFKPISGAFSYDAPLSSPPA